MKYDHVIRLAQALRRGIATAMLVPFLALCLLSPGAMLERDATGTLTMVLCTGDGPVEMTVDLGTGAPKSKQRCDWAAAHSDVVHHAPYEISPSLLAFHGAAPARATALWHPAYDPRNLWARGPPVPV